MEEEEDDNFVLIYDHDSEQSGIRIYSAIWYESKSNVELSCLPFSRVTTAKNYTKKKK